MEDEKWLADDDIAASLPQLVDSKPAVKKRPSTGKGDPCKQRKVDHPLFHTVSFKEAEMMLVDKVLPLSRKARVNCNFFSPLCRR